MAKKKTGKSTKSGRVPQGDNRLVANIRKDLHKRLKHAAVDREISIGELLEEMLDKYLKK